MNHPCGNLNILFLSDPARSICAYNIYKRKLLYVNFSKNYATLKYICNDFASQVIGKTICGKTYTGE